jgi:hypothetical protein
LSGCVERTVASMLFDNLLRSSPSEVSAALVISMCSSSRKDTTINIITKRSVHDRYKQQPQAEVRRRQVVVVVRILPYLDEGGILCQ